MRYTKILITNKNSEWGIITHPVAMNTYQHILSFDTPELKDWFINKHLFGDENFDYKTKIKNQPHKPLAQVSDTRATFKIDGLDYPNETSDTLLNKDFAIILQYDDETNWENYTFWAINKATKLTGNVYEYRCEIDIFFTYDIKDIFNNNDIQIDRAHFDRFWDPQDDRQTILAPHLYRDSINAYPEAFDDLFNFSHILIQPIKKFPVKSYYFIANSNYTDKNLVLLNNNGINKIATGKLITMSSDNELPFPLQTRIGFTGGVIFGLNSSTDNDKVIPYLEYFNTIPNTQLGVSMAPIELTEVDFGDLKWKPQGTIGLANSLAEAEADGFDTTNLSVFNASASEDFTIDLEEAVPIGRWCHKKEDIVNINGYFDPVLEGKIYKQPYTQIELRDCFGDNYQVDIASSGSSSSIYGNLSCKISQEGIHSQISFNQMFHHFPEDGWSITNINRGLYNIYNTSTDKDISEWTQYEAEHKAQFGVQKASAVLHTLIGGAQGVSNIIGGNYIGGASEIANAWTSLGQTLAMQKDLERAPRDIIAGGNIQHIINSEINTGLPWGRDFYQLNLRYLQGNLLYNLAWVFHISGVNYNNTMYDINQLIKSRYYFNYIKTNMSVFENIKEEYTISQSLRALIDNSLKQGLTIWHIRDKETFKGVKNYSFNNVEMSWL